ncbi:MAG: hypothetical protein ACRC33_25235 [Gemmataceae bacterium]
MTNENVLCNIGCPECGNEDRFFIVATILADVTDDGADIADHSAIEWDHASETRCSDCGRTGELASFYHEEARP